MKKTYKILAMVISLALMALTLTSCTLFKKTDSTSTSTDTNSASSGTVNTEEVVSLLNESDVTVSSEGATAIALNGASATVTGSGATADGSTVTITAGGTYEISGTLTDGRIIVNADGEEVTLILNNANITCSYSSAIYVYQAKTATVYLKEGTTNTLTDGTSYTYTDSYSSEADEEPNACLYSKDDLIIAGSGTLNINANFNNGITSKDTLKIESTNLVINAKNHGINGKDNLTVKNASLNVTAGGDALRSTNDTDTELGYIIIVGSNITVVSGEDGIQAETYVSIGSTTLNIKAGGGSSGTTSDDVSKKGIKAGTDLVIDSGTYVLDTADDAIHADNSVTINDGEFTITTGDDGIHADNTLTIKGGSFTISAHEGLEATIIVINDGTIEINATDDGINAAQKITGVTSTVEINGGEITINMGQGDTDGIDSNGNIIINGGTVKVNAQSPFDYDGQGVINGGTVYENGTQVSELTNQFAGGMGGMMGGFGGQMPDGQQGGQPPQGGRGPRG